MRPIVLTNQQFTCKDKPSIPDEITPESHGRFIARMEYAYDDCRDQLTEVKGVLEVQGATITDVLVEKKNRSKVLGIF